ncbi:abhydrolase associated lipase [Pelomyxa schiedti]|nr:abhydrolase associated lipase [Pelomyxa schiedti]
MGSVVGLILVLVCLAFVSWGAALLSMPTRMARALCSFFPTPGHGYAVCKSKNVVDHVRALGLDFEQHKVTTSDGHILTLYRIFRKENLDSPGFIPIFCQHGVLQNAGVFVANATHSPAWYLADRGFDVWLGNSRGVFPEHTHLSSRDPRFWDFTLDELGMYDFPEMVHYVSTVTKKQIVVMGHSQGASQAFIAFQAGKVPLEEVSMMVALAPAYNLSPMTHWLFKKLLIPHSNTVRYMMGETEFAPILFKLQDYTPIMFTALLGCVFTRYIFGWEPETWHPNQYVTYFLFSPARTSAKLIWGWLKLLKEGTIHPLRKVNTIEPWGLNNIRVPIAVFGGQRDTLVDIKPLQRQLHDAGCTVLAFEEIPGYNHMDLLWAANSSTMVYPKIVSLIRKHAMTRTTTVPAPLEPAIPDKGKDKDE